MRRAVMVVLVPLTIITSGCVVSRTPSPSQRWRPSDVVEAPTALSIALLSALHPADSMTLHADSLLPAMLTAACPGITILDARATEARLERRGIIVPRRINAAFIRQAHDVLDTDLLLAPTVLGILRGERGKWTGLLELMTEDYEDESAGVSLEGWDLRSSRPAVRVIRSRSSVTENNSDPLLIFERVAQEALGAVAQLCRPGARPD